MFQKRSQFKGIVHPQGGCAALLKSVSTGEFTRWIDADTMGLVDWEPEEIPPVLADMAREEFSDFKSRHQQNEDYYYLELERHDDATWSITPYLTETGEAAYAALHRGLSWNSEAREIDLAATAEMYRKDLKRGCVSNNRCQMLAKLALEYDELREVRNEMMYFTMNGTQRSGLWYNRGAYGRN